MPHIAIVTDTDCSLPFDVSACYHIYQVPIIIQFGDETFKTGIDIDDAQVFARVDREGQLPTTSAPAPGQFLEAYQTALRDGSDSILCFTVSGEVSATYAAAMNARNLLPDRDITVIDTRSLSVGQGFMALAAAEAALKNASKDACIACAQEVFQRTHLFAALSTLKYLAMSGRVGSIAAGMAGLLNIKPILTIRDGKLDLLERVRTQKKAWARLIELAAQAIGRRPIERMAIVHVAAPNEACEFEAQLRSRMPCPANILVAELTPGLSIHSGAGLVGVAFVTGMS